MITVDNLDVFYGKSQALRQVSLSVKPGEIVALIGANGAGKTTVLNAISGLIAWMDGGITFQGEPLYGLAPERIARKGISHVPERGGLFYKMTVMENLELGTIPNGNKGHLNETFEKVFNLFPILYQRKNQLGGQLSGGERQMLAIGRAMMSDPLLYLLDEPTLGLSPKMVLEISRIVREIADRGGTILLVEQNALMALELAKHAYVLEIGCITNHGPSHELLQNDDIRKAYLGI